MKATVIIGSIFLGLIGIFLLVFGVPIMNVQMDGCDVVTAEINGINGNTATKDISVSLKGDHNYYYINRGLEAGLQVAELKDKTLHQTASIHYARHWSLLNYERKYRHISRVTVGDEIIYNEIQDN